MKALYKYNPNSHHTVHGVPCDVIYVTCPVVAPAGFFDSPQACAPTKPKPKAKPKAKTDEKA